MSEAALRGVTNRVRLMVMRVVLALVSDGKKLQTVQVQGVADLDREPEHFQHYGFTSVPLPGAEGIGLSLGGSTNHMVVINVDDRRYRMKGLAGGEVALYDDQDMSVHLTRDGIVIKGGGKPMLLTDTSSITLDAADTTCTGNFHVAGAQITHGSKGIGFGHAHTNIQPGSGTSGPVA